MKFYKLQMKKAKWKRSVNMYEIGKSELEELAASAQKENNEEM